MALPRYLSHKAALASMIKSIVTYSVPWGIRFNSIAAGCMSLSCILPVSLHPLNPPPHHHHQFLHLSLSLLLTVFEDATPLSGGAVEDMLAAIFPLDMSAPALVPFKVTSDKDLTEEGVFSRSFIPMERAKSKEDIAGALLYLASRAGAYMNGSIMLVGCGKIAILPATY